MTSGQAQSQQYGGGLTFRNAYDDRKDVTSRLVAQGSDTGAPLVTISILTYKRPDFLVEAVRSAHAQLFDRPFEIIVMDDDPQSTSADYLLQQMPELRDANFRYYVHEQNLGQFPSHNRGIEYARGEWVSILHDDDLLDPDFLATMFGAIDRDRSIDGIICRKRTLHQHSTIAPVRLSLPRRIGKRMVLESFFLGRQSRRLDVRKFFWGAIAGNIAGFLFRRKTAMEVGGFYQEEEVTGDMLFVARFAKKGKLCQHRAIKATYRIADNLSLKLDNLRKSTYQIHKMKRAMIGHEVPGWWRRLEPLVNARDHVDFKQNWGLELPREEIEQLTGTRVTKDRPYLLWSIRILLRGY